MRYAPRRALLPALFVAVCWASGAASQSYPAKPIRMIVPFAPGGPTDILGRILAHKLGEALGQQVVVDNRGGAGGIIGTELVVKAPPDGYTLLMSPSAPIAINVTLNSSVPYDTLRDLSPVIRVANTVFALVVHPSLPVHNVKELIALLKARPDELSYASAGSGTPQHLAAELFKTRAGVRMTHVPYKGSGPATAEVVAGQVPISFETFITTLPHIRAGRLRALAQTGIRRSPHLPDVPTLAETVIPGYEAVGWFGLLAPAGTPRPVVARLHDEMAKALDGAELKQRLTDLGADPVSESPEQFRAFLASEIAKWATVIRDSGAKVD